MRFHFGRPPDDDYEGLARQMAEAQDDDHFPTTNQQRIAATLLEGAAQLEAQDRRRLQLDLLDIATKMISGDSYAWPRIRPHD